MSNISAIIQARMGSSRLPKNVLTNIVGRPMLWHIINRIKKSRLIDDIIIATTLNNEDDEIEITNRLETISKGIHAEIFIRQEKGKTFSFLNAGFPVNFDGRLECLPTGIIQATHGLLFAASIQTIAQKGPGINTVNPDDDDWIFKRAVNQLSRSPELN